MKVSDELPVSARAERYRKFAAQTLMLAEATDEMEIKATYLSLSACWKTLADKAEQFGLEAVPERAH